MTESGDGAPRWRAPGEAQADEIACVIVGTAGHIDHGKTALVQALTGVDTDRLQEEKERGMTIDLGFAPLRIDGRTVGVVDVPGHERFIKNMVAGATGIDLVLLVVAADDGVMPQTREHLEILTVLGLRRGLVAITKVDRPGVDAELLEAVELELDELVAGTFLEGAPRCRVSSITGEGVEALRAVLAATIREVGERDLAGPFRMPVQRTFTARGFGTVATGIPLTGRIGVEDGLVAHTRAGELKTRVRGLQAYGQPVAEARAGQSSALNLVDIDRKQLTRGDVLATPGVFLAGTWWEVRLRALGPRRRAFGRRISTVRVHVGTAEVLGEVVLLDAEQLARGEEALAQLRLRAPLLAAPGDPFLVRRHSPVETIGGGVILGRSRWRLKAFRPHVLERLRRREAALGDLAAQALIELEDRRDAGLTLGSAELTEAAGSLGCAPARLEAVLRQLAVEGQAYLAPGGRFLTPSAGAQVAARLEAVAAQVREVLGGVHRDHPTRLGCPLADLRRRLGEVEEQSLSACLATLTQPGGPLRVVQDPSGLAHYALADHVPRLPEAWEPLAASIRTQMRARGTQPSVRTLLGREHPDGAHAGDVVDLLLRAGEVIALDDMVIDPETYADCVAQVRALLAAGPRTVAQVRDALGASRRFAVALLEHLDREGITRRTGNQRCLVKAAT